MASLPGESPFERTMARMDSVERLVSPSPVEKMMQQMGERLARPLLPASQMDRLMGRASPMDKLVQQVGERVARPLMPASAMDRLIDRPFAADTAIDRIVKRLGRPMIDASAMNTALGHLESPLFASSSLDGLIAPPFSAEKLLERVARQLTRPLTDTSALDRAMEHFERSMLDTSALDRAATGLSRWLDDASLLDGVLETIDSPPPDPALAAALTEAARTLARKAGDLNLDSAQTGLNIAWSALVVYMVTYTDDEISPAVYAWVSLFFALLNIAARRQR